MAAVLAMAAVLRVAASVAAVAVSTAEVTVAAVSTAALTVAAATNECGAPRTRRLMAPAPQVRADVIEFRFGYGKAAI